MIQNILAFIVLIHALIHLMGFTNEWHLAEGEGFKVENNVYYGGAKRVMKVLWLIACWLFISAIIFYTFKTKTWYILAVSAVLLSQLLIFNNWSDAKYGTVVNVVILLTIITAHILKS